MSYETVSCENNKKRARLIGTISQAWQQDTLKWGVMFQNGCAHPTHILSTVTEF